MRPDLDKLRDLAVNGGIDKLYVQNPDRLACGAKLLILVEELQKNNVEVIFHIGATDDSAEGKLLLGVQGIIAEYERTKIAERTRRGRDYWSRQGAIVNGRAPYGYALAKNGQQRTCLVINEE